MVHNHLSASTTTSPSPSSSPTTTTLASSPPPSATTTTTSSPSPAAATATSAASSRYRRSSRKARHHHGINIPADTVLNFSTYHPPPPPSSSSSFSPNLNNNTYTYSTSSTFYNNYQHKVQTHLKTRPREQFVQANFRFLVAQPTDDTFPDLRTCQLLPEALVPWSSVDRVILPRPSDCCAICLSPLQCSRVTPCGHVFDHVCLLQLFAHAVPDKVVRCPLCFNSFTEGSLRPCAFATAVAPAVGNNMSMRLVSRNRGSMICHAHPPPPVVNENVNNNHGHGCRRVCHQHSDVRGGELENIPVVDAGDNPLFSRFAFTDPDFLLQLIQRDERDLYQVLSEDPSLAPFVNSAMADLELRRLDIRRRPPLRRRRPSIDDNPSTHTSSNTTSIKPPSLPHSESIEAPPSQPSTTVNRATAPPSTTTTHREKTLNLPPPPSSSHRSHHHKHNTSTSQQQRHGKGPWYFYQDTGSGNTFLHPINHRCLSTEFNNDFNLDNTTVIHGIIIEVEHHTMDEVLRKRYRFLEHLPDGCEFSFVELDLSHMLSSDTMTTHAQEIKDRENARRRRRIAHAKETERVEREQTNSLREYYTSLGRRPHGVCGFQDQHNNKNNEFDVLINNLSQQLAVVDRTDERNFPKLLAADGDDNLLSSSPSSSAHGSMAATNNSTEAAEGEGAGATITITSGYPIAAGANTAGGSGGGGGCVAASSPGAPSGGWGPAVSSYSSVTSNMGLFPALGSSPQADVLPSSSVAARRGAWGSSSGGSNSVSLTPPLGSSPQSTPRGVWANHNNGGGGAAGSTVGGHRGGGAWSNASGAATGLMMSVSPGNSIISSSSSSSGLQQTQANNMTIVGPSITDNRMGSTTTTTGAASNNNSQQASLEPRRNGRRSHGKSLLLLSNAGAQARR